MLATCERNKSLTFKTCFLCCNQLIRTQVRSFWCDFVCFRTNQKLLASFKQTLSLMGWQPEEPITLIRNTKHYIYVDVLMFRLKTADIYKTLRLFFGVFQKGLPLSIRILSILIIITCDQYVYILSICSMNLHIYQSKFVVASFML